MSSHFLLQKVSAHPGHSSSWPRRGCDEVWRGSDPASHSCFRRRRAPALAALKGTAPRVAAWYRAHAEQVSEAEAVIRRQLQEPRQLCEATGDLAAIQDEVLRARELCEAAWSSKGGALTQVILLWAAVVSSAVCEHTFTLVRTNGRKDRQTGTHTHTHTHSHWCFTVHD